jgi:hypothetical protein
VKFQVGDIVRIKDGVIGAGQTGIIEEIKPWNINSPLAELREDFHFCVLEDGVRAKFTADLLEKVGALKYRLGDRVLIKTPGLTGYGEVGVVVDPIDDLTITVELPKVPGQSNEQWHRVKYTDDDIQKVGPSSWRSIDDD